MKPGASLDANWSAARKVDELIMKLWGEKPWKEDMTGKRYSTCSSMWGDVTDHFEVSAEPAGVVIRCASEPAREFAERHVGHSTKDGIPIRIVGHGRTVDDLAAAKKAKKEAAKKEREKKRELQAERERYQRAMLSRPR